VEVVERVSLSPRPTVQNLAYLRAKRDRMGHLLDLPDELRP
jgi:3,4-dihydroxy 2-butanone 4-phosphate synthase / GTP cyclohydrolase II